MSTSLHQVLNQGQVWQARGHLQDSPQNATLDTGFTALNLQLPGGGWSAGQVCELYSAHNSGHLSLLLPALARLSQQPRWILWVGGPYFARRKLQPQPAALAQAGIDIRRILLVHPKDEQQALWCMEEGLKSGHCSAVLGWPASINKAHVRRLQLAATEHHSYCWLWPQCAPDRSGSPAALRLQLQQITPQTLQIECFKRRGLWPGQPFVIHQDTGF